MIDDSVGHLFRAYCECATRPSDVEAVQRLKPFRKVSEQRLEECLEVTSPSEAEDSRRRLVDDLSSQK